MRRICLILVIIILFCGLFIFNNNRVKYKNEKTDENIQITSVMINSSAASPMAKTVTNEKTLFENEDNQEIYNQINKLKIKYEILEAQLIKYDLTEINNKIIEIENTVKNNYELLEKHPEEKQNIKNLLDECNLTINELFEICNISLDENGELKEMDIYVTQIDRNKIFGINNDTQYELLTNEKTIKEDITINSTITIIYDGIDERNRITKILHIKNN